MDVGRMPCRCRAHRASVSVGSPGSTVRDISPTSVLVSYLHEEEILETIEYRGFEPCPEDRIKTPS